MMEAILLGAGLSKRMGRQKLLLPFGGKTVIEPVIDNLRGAGFERISLAIGLEMLGEGRDFCIMLADLPLATPEAIAALARRFDELPPEKTLLAPCRDGVFGHPMFYRAVWRERFRSAQGDAGGRKIVALYESEIERAAAPDCHFKDMDTPEDYAERVKQMEAGAKEARGM